MESIIDSFSNLFGEFSRLGRAKAMESLSELFQVQLLEVDPESFFIDSQDFICADFGVLEMYLNEKFGVILLFIRRALSHRMRELGIYSTPDEYDDAVVLEPIRREKLRSDMGSIVWFLSATTVGDPEIFYSANEVEVATDMANYDDADMLTDEEIIHLDNERRPLK